MIALNRQSFTLSDRLHRRIVIAILASVMLFSAESSRADAVTRWNEIMESTITGVDPFMQIRSAAITQLAVFEAVNSIECKYRPYRERIAARREASPEAAAIAAAHRALSVLHPDRAVTLDSLRAASLAEIPEGVAREQGIQVGIQAADAIIALRADDGSNKPVPYTPGTEPGEWQPTPPDFAAAFGPGIGMVRPFSIKHGAQFRIKPPPPLRSGRYARDYYEVKTLGDTNATTRTKEQTDVARFYEVTDGVQLYNPAVRQVSHAQGKTLAEKARIFALLNIAIFDAVIAVFDSKYFYNFWRPATAIQAGNLDGNRSTKQDPNWQPLIYTPPFPSYPSGHAGFGGAARRILESLLGKDGHTITLTHAALPDVVLHYSSWKEITDDVDDGRVFGGVHFRFDQEAAARQGKRVGRYVLRHELLPIDSAKRGGKHSCDAANYPG